MNPLENWLKQATRHLSKGAAAQVRLEIGEHYDSAREESIHAGAPAAEADRIALAAVGDAKATNCKYRQVLLTSDEAHMLRQGNWEVRAICSRNWLKWTLRIAPLAVLAVAAACAITGSSQLARVLLAAGIALGLLFVAPLLPLYTPARARIFRMAKWAMLLAVLGIALNWSWLTVSCLWPMVWIEFTRASLRRKLPVAQWPRQLYL